LSLRRLPSEKYSNDENRLLHGAVFVNRGLSKPHINAVT
jgi:hypothetical protein